MDVRKVLKPNIIKAAVISLLLFILSGCHLACNVIL